MCDGTRNISKGLITEGSETPVKELGFYPESRWLVKGFIRGTVSIGLMIQNHSPVKY